jgi:light-regulated signal transduction histidine kinase (bacteriophytochrome)
MQPTPADPTDVDFKEWEPCEVLRHVSHELRQPLGAIESIAYYLDIVLPHTETKARQQVRKLQLLVEQANGVLTDAARMLEKSGPRIAPNDLNELVTAYFADDAVREHTGVEMDLADGLPLAAFDPAQIRHLLGNLLRLVRRGGCEPSLIVRTLPASAGALLRVESPMRDDDAADFARVLRHPEPHAASGSGLAAAGIARIAAQHAAHLRVVEGGGAVSVELALPAA